MKPASAEAPQGTERLGKPTQDRPEGVLIWMSVKDGADAGAILSICKELAFIREEPVHCLVSTATDAPLVPSVGRAVIHQLTPVETQGSIDRFLDHWRPDVAIILGHTETPKLIGAAADRGVPMFYAAPNRDGLTRVPPCLAWVDACLAGSAAEARVLRE